MNEIYDFNNIEKIYRKIGKLTKHFMLAQALTSLNTTVYQCCPTHLVIYIWAMSEIILLGMLFLDIKN